LGFVINGQKKGIEASGIEEIGFTKGSLLAILEKNPANCGNEEDGRFSVCLV